LIVFRAVRLTDAIAAVTAIAWVAALVTGQADAVALWAGFIPARMTGAYHLLHAVTPWLTPLTCTLVHGGFAHLALNTVMLIFCGRQVEAVLGKVPLAMLYLVGAYAAAGAQFLVNPASTVPVIGASGAISALVGTYAMLFSRQAVPKIRRISPHLIRALWLVLAWTGLQLAIGVSFAVDGSPIAVGAHIGGFIVGLILARPSLAWVYRHA
jgi:membrane associated rhomboid family serine protease